MAEPSAPASRTLHEFQQQLSRRMQQARGAQASAQSFIAASTGTRRWLFELAHTAEMLPQAELTPVPFTHPWYLGLINHRSQLTGVIDLDAFAGAPSVRWQAGDRVLALSAALPLRCAIRVAQAPAVVDRARFRPAGTGQAAWCPQSFTDADGLRWDRVDLPVLMATSAFLDIARRPAPAYFSGVMHGS